MRPGRTVAPILTLNGSNDMFPPKKVHFGGQDNGWRHMGKIFPKNSQKGAWIGSFKQKTPKFLNRNISGTINPNNYRFEVGIQTTKSTSWVVCYYAQIKHNMAPLNRYTCYGAIEVVAIIIIIIIIIMADGRHLENRYDVIFQRRMFRFGRNSAAGCRMIRRLRRNGLDENRK